jgi:prepilin-type N-terminal cleavage/methylation domain-containing protein
MKIKNEKGFTLIELMVVIVIIIVVLGLGITMYFANLPHLRLAATTRGFKDDLIRAQQFAAKENRTVRVTQVSATSYEIVRITGTQDAPCAALVDDINVKTVDLANQYKNAVTIGSYTAPCAQSLIFGKLGAVESSASNFAAPPECGGEFGVNFQRPDGSETISVCINNSGRIRIQ